MICLSEKMLPARLAKSRLWRSGLFESYVYDKEGRLLCKTLNSRTVEQGTAEPQNSGEKSRRSIASLKYFYDADGTLTAREINGKLQTYEYDLKGQLIAVKESNTAGTAMPLSSECGTGVPPVSFETNDWRIVEQYVYDPAGNILKKIVNGKETIFSYDKANQLVSSLLKTENLPAVPKFAEANAGGTLKTDYQYDGAGRLISETSTDSTLLTASTKSYTYGWLDKVVQMTEDGGLMTDGGRRTTDFSYFPDGQLATNCANGHEENFYWDGLALIKRDNINYTIEPHVNGGTPIIAGDKVLFNDMLGTSIGSFDVESSKFDVQSRSSFGESFVPLAASCEDFFTGKPNIPELGYAFLFRNYRSDLGKWQTSDPLGYPDGWNNLAYVNNRVTDCYDFLGAWPESVHKTNTATIARGTGFTTDQANLIANADNGTDSGDTGPMPWQDQSRHFDRDDNSDTDSRQTNADNEMGRAIREWQNGNQDAALDALGRALHSLQDIDAHQGWDTGKKGIKKHPDWYDDPLDDRRRNEYFTTIRRTRLVLIEFRKYVGVPIPE